LRTCVVLNVEEALRKEVMQAPMIAVNIRSRKSQVVRRSAENRQFRKRNSQSVREDASTKHPTSPQPIENEKSRESEAIRQARDGDATAFECLYGLHSRRVYAVCLRMVGDTTEAEDLTQEAFLRLFRKIHTFRGESAFSTWLHRLVINTVLMHLRKKSLPAVSIEPTHDPDNDTGSSNIDVAAPDLFLEGSIDRINLGRCIAQLPVGYRTVFVLHDIQGFKHHEIAEMLGRSEGVSKSQLHRAHMRLRELLYEIRREKSRGERLAAYQVLRHIASQVRSRWRGEAAD
jgi:RNA polymerase sigma-70 factor, ECF subfamily